jgi:hypothetical protein
MTKTERDEGELTEKFIEHHMNDDSRDSYIRNGQWAYVLGYRAGVKAATKGVPPWPFPQRDSNGAIIIPPKPVPVREEALF